MIDIRPDPKRPRGGFAEITIADGPALSDPVTIAVFNSYQTKWLGPDGWQPNRIEIPARSVSQDDNMQRLIVGPEIVNQIEEDTPIRLEIAGVSYDTYWPDDINNGPDEAIVGDIGGTGAAQAVKGPTVMATAPPVVEEEVLSSAEASEQKPVLEEDIEPIEEDRDPPDDVDPPKSSNLTISIGGIVLLLIAAGISAYLLLQPTSDVVEDTPAPAVAAPQPVVVDFCSRNALAELGDFSAIANKMRDCGDAVSADNALGLIERAAAEGDAEALSLFGALYDGSFEDEKIEGIIGLTFSDQPARAAEYYYRAVAAGSDDAGERLRAICLRLNLRSDTLSQSAREDYCQ